ncbi:MAG: hypothetical protein RXO34_02800 [Nitrososphaeria archaeon]
MYTSIELISLIISIIATTIISSISFYGYIKVESKTLLKEGVAFLLITLGLLSNFLMPYAGFYFEAVGFLVIGLEHIKELKEDIAPLIIIPYVAGGTVAMFFSLYAGIETLIYYQKTRRIINLLVGAGLILVSLSIFVQIIYYYLAIGYIIQAIGYVIMLSALVH